MPGNYTYHPFIMLRLNIVSETVDQSWSVERIAKDNCPYSWESVFEEAKNEISHISQILENVEATQGEYYPLKKDLFAAFRETALPTVKVVIVGQDPYPQTISINGQNLPRATGMSF